MKSESRRQASTGGRNGEKIGIENGHGRHSSAGAKREGCLATGRPPRRQAAADRRGIIRKPGTVGCERIEKGRARLTADSARGDVTAACRGDGGSRRGSPRRSASCCSVTSSRSGAGDGWGRRPVVAPPAPPSAGRRRSSPRRCSAARARRRASTAARRRHCRRYETARRVRRSGWRGLRIVSTADRGPVLVKAGAEITSGVTLVEVRPSGVRIRDHGEMRDIELRTASSAASAAPAKAVAPRGATRSRARRRPASRVRSIGSTPSFSPASRHAPRAGRRCSRRWRAASRCATAGVRDDAGM